MGKTAVYTTELEELVWDPKNAAKLEEFLVSHSNLPGPRANLELAEAFTAAVSTAAAEPAAWLEVLYGWVRISAEEAPAGDPREFLPFCALLSFGVLYNTHACSYPCTGPCDCPLWPVQSEHLVETVRRAAADSRWRVREAVAMSLQHLGAGNSPALRRILDDWLGEAGGASLTREELCERRAVLAALAHPPLLQEEETARYALKTCDRILAEAAAVSAPSRKEEGFQILKKALSFTLSVFVAHLPTEGFELLERWARKPDGDIREALIENLKKKRLESAHPEAVSRLRKQLSE